MKQEREEREERRKRRKNIKKSVSKAWKQTDGERRQTTLYKKKEQEADRPYHGSTSIVPMYNLDVLNNPRSRPPFDAWFCRTKSLASMFNSLATMTGVTLFSLFVCFGSKKQRASRSNEKERREITKG